MSDNPQKHDCDETLHELYGYLDGELTTERRATIQHHLDDCSPCLETFDFEAELRMVIAQKCRDECPEQLRQRIAEALQSLSTSPQQPPAEGD